MGGVMETSSGVVNRLRRSLSGFIVITILLGTLAACTAPGSSTPATAPAATTLPAATEAATKAAPSPKASSAASPAAGAASSAASPAAGMATPVASPEAGMATPVGGLATPVSMEASAEATPVERRGGGRATPVGGEDGGAQCKDYDAWFSEPNVKAALELAKIWPEVIAEGEKAANGQPVDTDLMKKDYDQMAKVATDLRGIEVAPVNRDTAHLLAKAMGLVSRLAGALSDNKLDKATAASDVAAAKQAIADFEAEVDAQKARCS
jgi:hypothetical protein